MIRDFISPDGTTPAQRRVLLGASTGQFVEFYDFAIYGFSAVAIADAFFPSENPVTGLLAAFAAYGVAFVARPLGGLFFGALADRAGRRTVLYATLICMGVATALIGLLPTHGAAGIIAPVLLVVCRLAQGFSAGGEAVGAPSFVLEHAPFERRGTWIGVTIAASAATSVIALILIMGITGAVSDTAYASWGWRVPFLLALPLSLIGIYIRRRTEESPVFQELRRENAVESSPIRGSLRGNWTRLGQIFAVMALSGLGFYVLVGYFVTYLQSVVGLSLLQSLAANAVALLSFSVLLPIGGRLSDRYGRKPMLIIGAAAVAVVGLPAFLLVTSGSFGTAVIGQLLLAAALCTYGGGSYTFFVELLPAATRVTGAAISYNVAFALFGGTAPFVGTWLVDVTGSAVAPGYYLVVVALAALAVAVTTPETRVRERAAVSAGRG
ncbi:MHS family MFS transporter [Nonomuraea sp. MG754425]|uniref:MFS transporter n=1 Tax=Nonomuraea sp. MG754425 TaxID=2570319 RepID=UPI001F02527C|nr:MFS transporter [Nonomuraea sp. MG754425]MCF6476320.1 MHS family MFS transporter [Nonomuraea sp. MG754425]